MAHAISMDNGEMRATQNERFETLKRRAVPPDYQRELGDDDQHKIMDRDVYKATIKGDVEKFIDALEKVIELRKLALLLILNQVTPSGNSLLHVAASSGSDDVMELILIHFPLIHSPHIMTWKNSSEDTPLHVAIQDKRFDTTKTLIRWGTDMEIIYWKNKGGKSPLCLAIEKFEFEGQPREEAPWEILRLLLQESARDEAYAVKMGMSPILAAIKNGHIDILKEIIGRLPRLLHLRDEDGRTPMHAAASVGDEDAIGLLLEKCPYLAFETDDNGSYPIHISCEAGHIGVISQLLKDTWPNLAEIKNKKRQNILHVAAKGGKNCAVDRLLKKYSEPDTIEKLVNAKDVDGNTPLHLASMHNHCGVMRSLTNNKRFDLELRNNDGMTALDLAIESKTLSTENPAILGRAILTVACLRRGRGLDLLQQQHFRASNSSPVEWVKDQVNTLLLVATLVASVTFTASLTIPGGYDTSGDLPSGTATMLHHGMFQLFVIANMLAMYSSILAVVVLLWGLNRDFHIAELAYRSAGPLLLLALTGMSVAFSAAEILTVSKLSWFRSLVMFVGVLHPMIVALVLATLIIQSAVIPVFIVVFYDMVAFEVGKVVNFCLWFLVIILLVPAWLCLVCFLLCVLLCFLLPCGLCGLCLIGVGKVCEWMFHL